MSTYNGDKYLREQLNSIINQTNQNWTLYIRDDNSSDQTVGIIKEYANKYRNVIFVNENEKNNLGVVDSFMELLRNANADFYMFADQDDVWRSTKVEDELDVMLNSEWKRVPICVHTNLTVVDSQLNKSESEPKRVWASFLKVLFSNCVTGCTAMINDQLKSQINFDKQNVRNIVMHDWWFALIATQFGKLVYLNKSTMLYRQHENNVDGSQTKNTITHILYRLTHYDYDRSEMKKVIRMAYEFYHVYRDKLHGLNYEYVKEYGELVELSSFCHNLRLAFHLPPQERTLRGQLFFAYLMVIFNRDLLNINK